jgi:hypothetical protein
MKRIAFILLAVMLSCSLFAQEISKPDYKILQKKEDSLKRIAMNIITGRNSGDRFLADSGFTRILVRALSTKNSFYYPFDSLINISKLYAPDSSFRIFTWQLMINENTIRQHGAIQMRTADGSLKAFPLIDRSNVTDNMADTIANNLGWMGAVYYRIIQKSYQGRNYYTLLGFDENNIKSDKKIMDILEFVDGKPVFGNKIFVIENSNVYQKNAARFILEFKKEAVTRLSYDPDMDVIFFDELVSESNEPNRKWTLVPDGEFQGFKWINGKWVYKTQIFDGPPPVKYIAPTTIRDANGNVDPSKLKEETPSSPNN